MAFFTPQDCPGISIHYEVYRGISSENIFLVHGNMASNRWWHPSIKYWKARSNPSQNASIILAELRGSGLSSRPKPTDEISIERFALDFLALLADLKISKTHLVGHSTGGLVAAMMAFKSPQIFDRLVLLDPVGAKGICSRESVVTQNSLQKLSNGQMAKIMSSVIHRCEPSNPFFQDVIVPDALRAYENLGTRVFKALDQINFTDQIKEIQHQTLLLHGEFDHLLPIEDTLELSRLMVNSQFRNIPQHGHCLNIENPELFVSTVNNFLF